ncbi:MAG: response regulator [Nitrospirae bacterium]|nr:response regulator [Nitrospirota bacterium]
MEKIKVLIVEDTFAMRTFIKATIKATFSENVELDDAGSGESAMDKLAAKPFDVVICDWNMPGMKGTELLAWMKEQDNLKDIPFLMLTAHNAKDVITGAIEAGVSDFIMKPVSADVLSQRVRMAFKTVLLARAKKAGENGPANSG